MKYKVIYQQNNKIYSKIIDSLDDKPKNTIKIQQIKSFTFFKNKITLKELNLYFYELSMMLEAHLPLFEALSILKENKKATSLDELTSKLLESIKNGQGLQANLDELNINKVVKSFFVLANKKGDLNASIKAISKLIEFYLSSKAILLKALAYPLLLLFTLFLSLFFIFSFVLPSFESFILSDNINKSFATSSLFFIKDFLFSYFIYFLMFLLFCIFLLFLFYKKNLTFAYKIDKIILLKIPFLSPLVLSIELYKILVVLNILLKSNYQVYEALNSLDSLIKNKYLFDRISLIKNLLKNGKSLSYCFKKSELFNNFVISLLQTAEVTNSLNITIDELEKSFKKEFENSVNKFSFWIQPVIYILITSLIVWIIFAIFMPIWNMNSLINV